MYKLNTKCILNLCKNISYTMHNNHTSFKNIHNLINDYKYSDWEKYISNKSNVNYLLYTDKYIDVYLKKWSIHNKHYPFNVTKHQSFIKILNGSLIKIDNLNYSTNYSHILIKNDLLFLDSNDVYSIENNVHKNGKNNDTISLHIYNNLSIE